MRDLCDTLCVSPKNLPLQDAFIPVYYSNVPCFSANLFLAVDIIQNTGKGGLGNIWGGSKKILDF